MEDISPASSPGKPDVATTATTAAATSVAVVATAAAATPAEPAAAAVQAPAVQPAPTGLFGFAPAASASSNAVAQLATAQPNVGLLSTGKSFMFHD